MNTDRLLARERARAASQGAFTPGIPVRDLGRFVEAQTPFTPVVAQLPGYYSSDESIDQPARFMPLDPLANDQVPRGIGDINSDTKGSGARFNNGKPDLSLIPLTMLARDLRRSHPDSIYVDALEHLGFYQETHDPKWLFAMIEDLGAKGWVECAQVFAYGKKKYAAWNWAKGMPWSVPVACGARHLMSLIDGEMNDIDKPGQPGSQLPHRGHVFCNIVMLLQYGKTFAEGNDLPPKGLL